MNTTLCAALAGALFGAGLVISGMTDPDVVLAFLTLNEQWNPALIAVMGSAVAVASVGFAVARRRGAPLLAERFSEPASAAIDARLITGAALFGAGWGLSGYCPGPALVGVATFDYRAVVFVAAFALGLWTYRAFLTPVNQATGQTPIVSDG